MLWKRNSKNYNPKTKKPTNYFEIGILEIPLTSLLLLQKLLEELESLEVPAEIREARLESLKREAAQFAVMHEKKHGQYT